MRAEQGMNRVSVIFARHAYLRPAMGIINELLLWD